MFLSSSLGGDGVIEGPITQHGEQDVAATPSERDQGLVVPRALTDLALVVRPGDRVAQGGEGREEQRALEHLVAPPGGMFSADRGSGATRHRGEPRVSGQVRCGVEVAADDLRQESCGGLKWSLRSGPLRRRLIDVLHSARILVRRQVSE